MITEKLLTLPQTADYLQVSTGKLYRMAKKGRIPASKLGGSWRFKKSRIDKWIDELETSNTK
ncbi:MAG: helix-turn-helix domain-containing protein [Candidatus Omnitrophica bacterium]|nr:helix-turn-helix domain-containing protein [Candidatus Omnitrophota bacterium]